MPVIPRLYEAIGEKNVLTGDAVHEQLNGFMTPTPMQAKAIVYPRSTEDVSTIMKICHDARQPVVIQGGKSGGVQGHIPTANEIAISFDKMSMIEEIDTRSRTATVQAGCILETLQDAVEDEGLIFPLDLGGRGSCTIGGNISTNAGGIRVVRYGMMREQVLGLEAVLTDGSVISSMNSVMKNNTGYDLKQLFIGAEGTLGVVTRAVLRLRPKMSTTNVALLAMENFDQVLKTLQAVDAGLSGQMTAYELMSSNYYQLNAQHLGYTPITVSDNYKYFVVVESQGCEVEQDQERMERVLTELYEQDLITDAALPKSQKEIDQIWAIRESVEAFMQKSFFLYDVSVPMKHMEKYIRNVESSIKKSFVQGKCYSVGHVGDGNLHFVIIPNCEENHDQLHRQINDIVYKNLTEFNGSVSAEHVIGWEKKEYLSISRDKHEMELMRTLKRALDPRGILGRGRIFD